MFAPYARRVMGRQQREALTAVKHPVVIIAPLDAQTQTTSTASAAKGAPREAKTDADAS